MTTAAPEVDGLVARGLVFGLLARLLADDPTPLASAAAPDGELAELRRLLESLGEDAALDALDDLEHRGPFDHSTILARRVRLFDTGKVPPYELSHVPPGAASTTGMLADVSGFYRAYNLRVTDERPDHCVAELEFASMVSLAEADCRERGDEEGAALNAATARRFLGDHLGGWLDILAAKLESTDPGGPFGPVVTAAARFVDTETSRLGVIPVRRAGIVPDWDDWEDEVPVCGSDVSHPSG